MSREYVLHHVPIVEDIVNVFDDHVDVELDVMSQLPMGVINGVN